MEMHRTRTHFFVIAVMVSALLVDILTSHMAVAQESPTVLITGSSRGMGFELTKQYAANGWTVIATCRTPGTADALNVLADKYSNIKIEALDVTDNAQIEALAKKYTSVPIDVLINNAGIFGPVATQTLEELDYGSFTEVMAVNVYGPLKMSQAFADSVAASEQKKIVAITSLQASIGGMREPLIPFYKMSKTALNMGMKSTSKRVKGKKVTVALISPGAVDTRMMNSALDHAGFKGNFLITPEESAEAVINIIDQYDLKMTGTFMSHRGDVIPW
jgi:NAD(P)-dependent dehydrogenase (short-subunit alcohol dehydrogenase family)